MGEKKFNLFNTLLFQAIAMCRMALYVFLKASTVPAICARYVFRGFVGISSLNESQIHIDSPDVRQTFHFVTFISVLSDTRSIFNFS